ncbi:MAG: hypothetical protein BWZ02_02444 [Lentisphaerae bacterium ADurb.BinA184]|nr:MAG: hypothetical protein BWZ02_02444 [Lentisphaerae bacterium ADurb.BinA184]
MPVPAPDLPTSDYLIGAHYFPGWKHGDHWGWSKIEPFPERKPLLGWYDEDNPEVADWEVKWALEHGIQFFVYCWYRDKARMGEPMSDAGQRHGHAIHQGLFRSTHGNRLRFAIMWECHNAGVAQDERDLLDNLLPYWADTYFSRPNYLRLNGMPVLFVYSYYALDRIAQPFGGEANLARVFERLRAAAVRRGFPGLVLPFEYRETHAEGLRRLRQAGADMAFAYCWHTPQRRPTAAEAIAHQLAALRAWREAAVLPFMATATVGWDPLPWQQPQNPKAPWLHPETMTRWKLPPADWRSLLLDVKAFMDAEPAASPARRLLLLDNWNEWGEGHYLAPQVTDGFAYLQAVREVFTRADNRPDDRLPADVGLGPYDAGYAAAHAPAPTPPPSPRPAAASRLLPAGWDAKLAGDRVLAGLRNVCLPAVKGAHDSDFLIVDGRAYIVYMANDVQPGEAPDWPFVYNALSIVGLDGSPLAPPVTFAASGKAYENETLPPGACFVPRILRRDARTLRCFFASEAPGRRQSQTWFIDFDLAHGAFDGRIRRAELETGQGVFPMQPQPFHRHAAAQGFAAPPVAHGLCMIDGFKRFDGRVHAVLNNFPGGQNAWSVLSPDATRFTILGDFFLPHEAKLTEAAVNRLPDGTWCAISRRENGDGNYLFTESPDGVHWAPHTARAPVHNGTSSKPTFDCFGGVYYLGWQEGTRVGGVFRSVFNLDVSRDGVHWERKYRFESERSFQYPTFRDYEGAIYLTVTQGDASESRKERILFGRLE